MNPAPKTVIVLRFSAVGDVLLTAPAVQALKQAWPDTRIVFAVKERLAHLVRFNPHVADVVGLRDGEGVLSYAKRLRAQGPGAVLDLQDKLRSKALRTLLPVPAVVWTKRAFKDTWAVSVLGEPYRAEKAFADRYHEAVEALVGRSLSKGDLRYWLGPDDAAQAEEELRKANVSLSLPIIGLSPGAKWETKRWPLERFAAVARRALAAGYQVVVAGSQDEAPLGAQLAKDAPGTVDLSGRLGLAALGGFISKCTAFVANDSGPMHMARALFVPTLAIFGSTDPKMFRFDGHARLFAGVECSPCSFFGRARCPEGHFRCMRELDETHAWAALEPMLKRDRPPAVTG